MTTTPDTTKRKRKPVDSVAYAGFMTRVTRNFEGRAKDDGIDALHSIAEVQRILNDTTASMVAYLRSPEGGAHSWAAVGAALGITRQSAQERFGKK